MPSSSNAAAHAGGLPLWPRLADAWAETQQGDAGVCGAGPGRWRLLKGESRTRVLLLEADGYTPLVLKVYAIPPRLAWRTLGMVSRANREFTAMMEAHRLGLPVVRPRYRVEERVAGCLRFGALALDVVDHRNLESLLDQPDLPAAERNRVAGLAGDVLGRFHRAGLQWATATPRNLLLTEQPDEPLQAIDMPYATLASRDISGSAEALMDLSCIVRMSDGRLAFDGASRSALMLGYCQGDAAAAQALDERVQLQSHLAWKKQRLRRRINNLLKPGARSRGLAGRYVAATGGAGVSSYEVVDSQAVTLPAQR